MRRGPPHELRLLLGNESQLWFHPRPFHIRTQAVRARHGTAVRERDQASLAHVADTNDHAARIELGSVAVAIFELYKVVVAMPRE